MSKLLLLFYKFSLLWHHFICVLIISENGLAYKVVASKRELTYDTHISPLYYQLINFNFYLFLVKYCEPSSKIFPLDFSFSLLIMSVEKPNILYTLSFEVTLINHF